MPGRRGRAHRERGAEDPPEATHAYVGAGQVGFGRFEADEPDTRFRVFKGASWRRPNLDPSAATYDKQVRVGALQDDLVNEGVLGEDTMTFARDHVFENWTLATYVVSGKNAYSGARHWQLLTGTSDAS